MNRWVKLLLAALMALAMIGMALTAGATGAGTSGTETGSSGEVDPGYHDPTICDGVNHVWQSVTYPATCTTNEVTFNRCIMCGYQDYSSRVEIPNTMLGHIWDETNVEIVIEPVCQTPGSAIKKCLRCGVTKIVDIVGPHKWTAWEIVIKETCSEKGLYQRHCTICNRVDTKIVDASGKHVFNMENAYVARRATCTVYGTFEAQCTLCGEWFTYVDYGDNDAIATLDGTIALKIRKRGHNWGYAEIVNRPTCMVDGRTVCVCQHMSETALYEACDSIREEIVDHSETAYDARVKAVINKYHELTRIIEIEATPQSDGLCIYRCTVPNCSYRSMEVTYAFTPDSGETDPVGPGSNCDPSNSDDPNHSFSTVVLPATCTNGTITFLKCTACGLEKDRIEQEDALGYPEHLWDENNVELISTGDCMTPGSATKVCLRCGFMKTVAIAGSHSWTAWELVSQETCVTSGTYKRYCTICQNEDTKMISATGKHIFDLAEAQVFIRANCTTYGTYEAPCTICGQSFTYTDWGDNDATAIMDGTIALKINKRRHDFGYTEIVSQEPYGQVAVSACRHTDATDLYEACDFMMQTFLCDSSNPDDPNHTIIELYAGPSCTIGTVIIRKCRNCGMELERIEEEPALGHLWDESNLKIVIVGDCMTGNVLEKTCTRCGATERFTTEGTHSWVELTVEKEPTCVKEGLVKRMCAICGKVDFYEAPATGIHEFDLSNAMVKERASCVSDGTYRAPCTMCGQYFTCSANGEQDGTEVLRIPARGHNPGDGEVEILQQVSCIQDGIIRYTCQNSEETELYEACSEEVEEVIYHGEMVYDARVGEEICKYHQLVAIYEIGATYTRNGIGYYKCLICGDKSKEVTLPKLEAPEGEVLLLNAREEMNTDEYCDLDIVARDAKGLRLYNGELRIAAWDIEEGVNPAYEQYSFHPIMAGEYDFWASACYEDDLTDEANWTVASEHYAVRVIAPEGDLTQPVITAPAAVQPGVSIRFMVETFDEDCGTNIYVYNDQNEYMIGNFQWGVDQVYYTVPAELIQDCQNVRIEAETSAYGYNGAVAGQFVQITQLDPYDGSVLSLPDFLTAIEAEAFQGCGARTVVIPEGCLSIGDGAFSDSLYLCFVIVPDDVTSFGANVFAGSPVTLICSAGSPADAYATANGIPVRRP